MSFIQKSEDIMKFELLLLLFSLIGSFCTISHASTLVVPTEEELAQVTGASMPTEATDRTSEGEDALNLAVTHTPAPDTTEAAVKETEVPSTHSEVPVLETEATSDHTEAPAEQTEAPLLHTPEKEQETTVGVTETPAANTVDEDTAATEGTPEITPEAGGDEEATETSLTDTADEPALKTVIETGRDEVEVEDSEGLSTGQVVGIVFGALVAVVIIIAVIVVVVRRMGQYSP